MKSTRFVPVVAALATLFTTVGLTTTNAATDDLNTAWGDGSATSNPNGPWSLRYGGELLTNHYWMSSESAWIWDWNGSTVPSFAFETVAKWNDCFPGDIVMQGTFGGQPASIRWTAPRDGVIDISGRTWDAYGGRPGTWTLAVGATQVAGGTIAASSKRTSVGVSFGENALPGKTLIAVPVTAGTAVVFTQDSASAGVQFKVSYPLLVGNVRAAQRPGTKLVDIDYDLTNSTDPMCVALEISADGGTTWAVPATTLTGAVGNNITPATNLRITWDAGVDWNNRMTSQMQFRLKVNETLTDFALIPSGTFTMGDTLDGMADAPPHQVNVSTFQMQKKGVTKAEWDAVRTWGLTHGYEDLAMGAGKAADHPVQTVSWYDVVKWCNAKSEMDGLTPCYYTDTAQSAVYRTGNTNLDSAMVKWTGNGYRLPTEAEREKAARGGQAGQRFPWGNTISHANANFYNGGGEPYATGTDGFDPTWGTGPYPFTSPAGSFPANAYGIYDMAGNMWEWCWDWYGASYYASSPATDPTGPSGSFRVRRGGSWPNNASGCRVAIRGSGSPGPADDVIGFRPVRTNNGTSIPSTDTPIDTREWAKLTIIGNGTTSPTVGEHQVPKGSPVEITALTPAPGYLPFSNWTGAATGTTNPVTVTMDADKTVTAVFDPDMNDSDDDGLTNYQEHVVYFTNPNLKDTDGDGFHDGYEVEHGYSPILATSKPDTRMVIFTAVEVRFAAGAGKSYRIESSFNNTTWTPVESGIPGTGGEVTRFYTIQAMPKRFFRAVEE